MTREYEPILIIGGTGKTGRRVAEKLTDRGVAIRVASRSAETVFDWNDRSTWHSAIEGVSAVYVTYSPDLAVPEAPRAIEEFAGLAAEYGLERLVLLSGRGEEEAQRCERIILDTNPSWTIVRASWFNQNFSESFFLEPLLGGVLALPAGEVGEPFVDAEDIADVAVAALTETGHEGQIYEVTGPRLLTFTQAVDEIARASGRDLRYVQVPVDSFARELEDNQVPEEVVSLTRYLFETVLDGRNASTSDGVLRALGRAPRDFADYARDTAATGLWAVSSTGGAEKASKGHMTKNSNELVMRRFVAEIVNQGEFSSLKEIVDPNYVFRSPGEEVHGPEELEALIAGYRGAFPDLNMAIDELMVADDVTVLAFTLTGTHRGDLLGIPATGRQVNVQGMVRSRFRDGRIAEEWEILDQLSLFEQIGVVGGAS